MNFFKSVFSGDPDPTDSSSEGKSPSDSPRKPRENEKGEGVLAATEDDSLGSIYHTNTKPSIPWAGIGSLIKNFASKSESVIQTYRRDLEEFSSGLKKETEAIREVASRAVRDLPYSLEAGASAAQESLESVGQAIDDFGGSVWRGTAEIISEGKDALLAVDSDVDAYSDPQIPSSTSIPASASKRYSRFDAQLLALQSDPNTFSEEPEDDEDFCKWKVEFMLEEKEEEIELLCYDNGILEGLFEKLVPSVMDYKTFWIRYFYKLHKLKLAEDARANLVKRVISREDEDETLTWEVDDDEEEWKDEEKVDEKEDDKGKESKGMEISGSEDEVKVVSKEESKSGHVEEGKENAKEKKEANKCDYVEVSKEKGSNNEIELEHEKSPGLALEDMSSVVTTIANDETVVPCIEEEVDDTKSANNDLASGSGDKAESANNHLATESDEKVPKSPSELLESLKDINISVVEIQNSMPEEEDLGWDEIEDLSEHDKNVGVSSSTVSQKDLHERVNVAEDDDDDLAWDIEDDD